MIVVTDDELKKLEEHFGPDVRHMGTWNSDGVFGYSAVPVAFVEKAAQAIGDPGLLEALHGLKKSSDRNKRFIEMLQAFGPTFVEKIAATYRECATFEVRLWSQPFPKKDQTAVLTRQLPLQA
ncbi:MAG: hypothetical protein LAQ69_00665 [Acidobacteriia bacterium]|nr:hypothetical protein [Terriglobia bacterium]